MEAALRLPAVIEEDVFDNDADFEGDAYDNLDVEGEAINDNNDNNDINDINDNDSAADSSRRLSVSSSGRPRSVSNPEVPQHSILKLTPASMAALAVGVRWVSVGDWGRLTWNVLAGGAPELDRLAGAEIA